MPLSTTRTNLLTWGQKNYGTFDINNAYKLASPPNNYLSFINLAWNRIWKLNIPYKYKMLMQHLVHEILPLGSVLARKIKIFDPICSRCFAVIEGHLHLYKDFHSARVIWNMIFDTNKNVRIPNFSSFFNTQWIEWTELNLDRMGDDFWNHHMASSEKLK